MRVTSFLLSLAAVTPFVFAQDNAEGGESAPAPAAEGGDAGAQAGSGGESAAKTHTAVGAHSSNTGHGTGTGNQDWVLATFDVPNRNYYCEFSLVCFAGRAKSWRSSKYPDGRAIAAPVRY